MTQFQSKSPAAARRCADSNIETNYNPHLDRSVICTPESRRGVWHPCVILWRRTTQTSPPEGITKRAHLSLIGASLHHQEPTHGAQCNASKSIPTANGFIIRWFMIFGLDDDATMQWDRIGTVDDDDDIAFVIYRTLSSCAARHNRSSTSRAGRR